MLYPLSYEGWEAFCLVRLCSGLVDIEPDHV